MSESVRQESNGRGGIRTDESNAKPAHAGIGFPLAVKLSDDTGHDEVGNSHGSTTEDGKLAATHLVEVEKGRDASGLSFSN
jgi:hypothetical protein